MRREVRRALVGGVAGAVFGALVAVVYTRVLEEHAVEHGDTGAEGVSPSMRQVATVALHVINVVRQILSLA